MFKTSRNYLLLSVIFVFSFVFRVVLMLREVYPPGADIGLHSSIIHSITQGGNTDFLWNYYHMGGGVSLTFPGYHIFVSSIVMMTGISEYVAHALVVSLFSSLIVFCAYLVTRKVWNENAALIVAFLMAVSRFDVEMLMWGGYPNVITLMLIPLAFYLFLKKDQLGLMPFLGATSLVSAAIFLTHSLSAAIFIAVTFATVLFALIFSRKQQRRARAGLLTWFLPLALGALIISPFLIEMVPTYLGASAETVTGGVADIRLALLSTKILPLEIVIPLFACVILFFLFSKEYKGRFLTVPAILLAVWTLIPAALTQGYLVGLYTDYNRFMYFVILPVVMLIGMVIYHSATFFTRALDWLLSTAKKMPQVKNSHSKVLRKVMPHLSHRNILATLVLVFLLYVFLAVPVFVVPSKGVDVQVFYQTMTNPRYEAILWAKNNTAENSIFVTDALYGWWFSGFAQRSTISAVDPQYLTLTREFEPAKFAGNLLDTDYLVDNGLIQVREDGGYIGRHNPIFLAKLNDSYFPYPFFHFSNNEISAVIRDGENVRMFDMAQLRVKDMHMENGADYASIYVVMENELFNFTEKTTIYQGKRFASVTATVEGIAPQTSFDIIRFLLHTKGFFVMGKNETVVAYVDPNMKVAGQLIFKERQPQIKVITAENRAALEMTYNLEGRSRAEMNFYVGIYEFEVDNPDPSLTFPQQIEYYQKEVVMPETDSYLDKVPEPPPLDVFDYRQAVSDYAVSYVALRDSEAKPRFAKDPLFSLVFNNDEVAIFQVQKDFR